jgi:hypothetical protein
MKFHIYRDCDQRFRVRKVVVELWNGEALVDRRRMFAGPLFALRLKLKMKKMKHFASVLLASQKVVK